MKHLKLKRGLSYMGHGVSVTKAAPFASVADDAQAEALLASGYFEEVQAAKAVDPDQTSLFEDTVPGEDDDPGEGDNPDEGNDHDETAKLQDGAIEAIDTMGVTKLRDYAKKHGVTGNWPAGTGADVIREDIRKALTERE